MSLLTESINVIRAEQLRDIAEKEAAEKAKNEALEVLRAARQAKIDQIYSSCEAIIDESRVMKIFGDVNREFFNGTGESYCFGNLNSQRRFDWHREGITDFYVKRGIKGVINKTPTLLTAEASLSELRGEDVDSPALTIRCQVGTRASILGRVFRRRVKWNWGPSETLGERVLEEQDQPIKEWQNPDNVAKLTAKVLLNAGVV